MLIHTSMPSEFSSRTTSHGQPPHPIFIRPFGVEMLLLLAPALSPTVPTTVKGIHLSFSPIRYKSTESRHSLLFFLSTPDGSSMLGAHRALTNICWMSKWKPVASSMQHKTKAQSRLVFESPIFSTERTENIPRGDRSSFHQPSPGTEAQWGERLMQQAAWAWEAGDLRLPYVFAGGPVESWALAWPPEAWVSLFSYRDNDNPSGFLGGTSGKEPVCQCRRCKRSGFDPWVWKIPWRRDGNLFQYSCLKNPMDRGAWRVTVHGVTRSRTWVKQLSTYTCNDNPHGSVVVRSKWNYVHTTVSTWQTHRSGLTRPPSHQHYPSGVRA